MNMNPNKEGELVSFYLNMNTNPNSKGVLLCMYMYSCVDMYDHTVALVLYHSCWYINVIRNGQTQFITSEEAEMKVV